MSPKGSQNYPKIKEKSPPKPNLFFCKTLILAYPPMVLHDLLVLGGPGIDQKSIKNQDLKKHLKSRKKNTKIQYFGVRLSGRYALLMPSKITLISFFFDHGPFWRARTPQDPKMIPKSLQNDPQNHKNNINLIKIDVQK